MYTQCPECSTAFRVTAEVLKQAAGKVRCGGCGIAFNALDFLSEQKPESAPKPAADGAVPELTPEPGELEADKPPKTISADQSAALLKTLDELAGSDIRIEDTGVEWRVLDDNEEDDAEPLQDSESAEDRDDTGSMKWFIDESPTPVDEHLSAEPGALDSPEIFEEPAATDGGKEMRFDDDTPLPDDFDFDSEPAAGPAPVIEARDDPSDMEAAQVDLALGDPEDWEDLLGEVDERVVEDDTPEPDDVRLLQDELPSEPDQEVMEEPLPDVDEQFATQAEAMGIDLSGIHAKAVDEEPAKDKLEDPSIDDDLIAAAFEAEAAARTAQEEAADEPEMELDEEGAEDLLEDEELLDDEEEEDDGAETAASAADEDAEDLEFELEFDEDDLVEARDRELVISTEEDQKLAAELGLDSKPGDSEPVILPQSEDELTVNMMIDEDLLAIAVEDEEGFASTIVQKQTGDDVVAIKDVEPDEEAAHDVPEAKSGEDSPLVETIIMEGEFIRDANEEEELEEARKKTGDPKLKSASAAQIAAVAKQDEPPPKKPINYGLVAGIAALGLLLAVQALHQYREALATYPAFSSSVGSIYRMFGRPVTPSWDISGWRFEATKGSTDDDDEILTIYSRVGNKSDESLPYPLISVSLTDRFEDIIGSKVLEPGDYLAENLDTRRTVEPGDTFSAVISIEAPDAEATGFKLNVCYRQTGGQLKCAIDDFK
jgi:predicted Zn finger-like uncharacterized protein